MAGQLGRIGRGLAVEFREVVRKRRMVRNYDPDRSVPPEITQRILEHAIRAPSAGFSQGWGFLVLEERVDLDRFWAAATLPTQVWQQWLENMRHAPLIIVPHSSGSLHRLTSASACGFLGA